MKTSHSIIAVIFVLSIGSAFCEPVPIAQEITRAYAENEIQADSQYKGKSVTLTATIDGISRDVFGSPYIALGKITAYFPKSAEGQIAALKKGQSVTVKGTCGGKVFDFIVLNEAQLLK